MSSTNNVVTIESQKFLAAINDSAQAQVAQFERLVENIGNKSGQKWRLAALNGNKLVIEDIRNNRYYLAEHAKQKGGKVNIFNINQIAIVEDKKQSVYDSKVLNLLDAIEENDQRGMRSAWKGIASHRFSGRNVPASGLVRTRDGVVRHIPVQGEEVMDEHTKARLVAALVESVTDQVVLENGRIINASFNTDPHRRIPVSEWTCRKVVGNYMREAAQQAYLSPGFQNRIYKVAQLIEKDNIKEAVESLKDFLAEMQEFSLLNRKETGTLVENALAAKAVFNQDLCNDTATLFYRTNLKVNRDDIVKEWRTTAQKAQHPILLENVSVLERAKNFDSAYDTFLNMIFNEAMSPRDEEIESYRKALELLRDTSSIKEDADLSAKLNELLTRLNESDVDDATVNVVRETLAAARKEVDALKRLEDFDQMPGDSIGEDLADELESDDMGGEGAPTININSPLIQIGGTSSGGGEPMDDLGGGGGLDDLGGGEEEEEDLGGLGGETEDELGGLGGGEEDELGGLEGLGLESKSKGKAITEADKAIRKALGLKENAELGKDWSSLIAKLGSKADELNASGRSLRRRLAEADEMCDEETDDTNDDDGDDGDKKDEWQKPWEKDESVDESTDPYAFDDVETLAGIGSGYGVPALGEEVEDVVQEMFNIAEEKDIQLEDIENISEMAREAIKRSGVKLPENKINEAIKQAGDAFAQQLRQKLDEDQYKFLDNQQRGRANRAKTRSSFEKKHDTSGGGGEGGGGSTESADLPGEKMESRDPSKFTLISEDKDNCGILFENQGVQFILDYAEPPLVTSVDNAVQLDIPGQLKESALAAARVNTGDPKPFLSWVMNNIEQLRTIPETEENSLDEAIASIRTGPDGSIDVSVDSEDPQITVSDVNDVADVEGGEMDGEMDGEMGMDMGMDVDGVGGEAGMDMGGEEGMQPIDDVGGAEVDAGPDVDAVPDFEGGVEAGDKGPEHGMEVDDAEVEEEGAVMGEDHDMTDPTKGEYNTADDELRDQSKQGGKAAKKGNGNKLDGFSTSTKKETTGKKDTEMKPVKPGENRQE